MAAVVTLWVFRDRIGQNNFTHWLTKRVKNTEHHCGLWKPTRSCGYRLVKLLNSPR